ncbi:MAG: amidohydrolase family protein [Planctomycetes bacterium]|nr:amidohydrolase family protein [Planctomycetota bacterium]
MIRRGLILTGGTLHTLEREQAVVRALMAFNGVVEYAGDDLDLQAMGVQDQRSDWLRVLDLSGRAVIPGLVSVGRHLLHEARALGTLDLSHVSKASELFDTLRTSIEGQSPGAWIVARGLAPELAASFPGVRDHLDRLAPKNPLLLHGADAEEAERWAVANSLALRAVVDDPERGLRESGVARRDGVPSGRIEGRALERLRGVLPDPAERRREPLLENALRRCVARGITSVLDVGGCETFALLARLHKAGGLPLRVATSILPDELDACRKAGVVAGFGDGFLRRGGMLLAFDSDASFALPASARVEHRATRIELARQAASAGFPLWLFAPHADAVAEALDLLDTIAIPRPAHLLFGVRSLAERERQRLERSGVHVSFAAVPCQGSEPVPAMLASRGGRVGLSAPPDDRPALAALASLLAPGRAMGGGSAAEYFELGEALRANIVEGARALGIDARLGTLGDGQKADLLILDRDPFLGGAMPRVVATFVAGEVRYELPGWERRRA